VNTQGSGGGGGACTIVYGVGTITMGGVAGADGSNGRLTPSITAGGGGGGAGGNGGGVIFVHPRRLPRSAVEQMGDLVRDDEDPDA